jgi:two-component system, OmpR family, sensor histidine kinase BaeS
MRLNIKYKLFFLLLSAHLLVYLAMYSVGYYNFSQGFLDYVSRIEERQIPALLKGLEQFYQNNRTWEPIRASQQEWSDLIAYSIESAIDPDLIENRRRTARPTPVGFTPNDWYYTSEYSPARPYLHLLDSDQQIVRGNPGAYVPELVTLNPVVVDGETVGFLAVTSRQQLSEQADLLFAEQQQNSFIFLALVLGLISASIAFPAATVLTRPIREVVAGTRALTNGDYSSRLPVRGSDEISQLSEDFNTLAKTLDQNRTARQQWIADISHELRTPLAILRGELEAVQDGVRPLNAQTLDSLHQEVVHLTTLVNDLHELSLSDIGALVYERQEMDLGELLEQSIEKHSSLTSKSGLKVELMIGNGQQGPLEMLGDPDRLLQLFDNLLQNSCRYTASPGQIKVEARKQGNQIVIDWYDSEPGVNDQDLEHLFDRLYRVETSRNRAQGGSGLGLAICQNIVHAHEGTIKASHSPLGGLRLTLCFPCRTNQVE